MSVTPQLLAVMGLVIQPRNAKLKGLLILCNDVHIVVNIVEELQEVPVLQGLESVVSVSNISFTT